jgi:hypothetical protein
VAIAKVQEVFSYSASGGSATKNVTIAAPGAGNTLFLLVQNISAVAVTGVTGGGVTWAQVATWTNATGASGELWAGPNSSGSGTTVAVTVAATYSRHDLAVLEFSGMPTALTADGGSNANTNNPDNLTPAVTPTAGTPTVLLAIDVTYTRTTTAGPTGGFTAISTAGGSTYGNFAYQLVASAAGAYQCGWTASAAYATSGAGLYAFSGTAGGATGHPAVRRMGGVQHAHGGPQPGSGRNVW